jgi:hypothetical protein
LSKLHPRQKQDPDSCECNFKEINISYSFYTLSLGPDPGGIGNSAIIPDQESYPPRTLPFSKKTLEKLINVLNLPKATPWSFSSKHSHFQKYHMTKSNDSGIVLG